ncbi:tannase/feruloyl esterase family alpha/beta hydrolase [Agrobacterium rhizogenes]|uniref:tannase/feruloyl esterase family alpha/beta hydrolase n=1 Tax=Rhizobium rhizogenes TaxID=359 RepID=UPI00123BC896|nr:tannase/feruloyl esterase family alpha/beta hydrolase [Rhizobium rhizogenes]KAA6476719.1 tannase/feruloyl esterase family alpha/beta hydrolase [Agrobacterium sp. ICMP 7243]NTF51722.1 tannase/feruloyl esterase family alpha/beta hydrolase [Rhizobium rhizogenes]NTG17265.1 tannase/feruloyl esterase family alpha/beta hydrolase [Rhizobium rhizogenes]NTG23926.1 tannase/feruloyl esterase family alpha/beta hydrolase [Rhizobium rhizogenes]NTG30869.1 tannase/feruloyl esterase family alpha/beta hydrola
MKKNRTFRAVIANSLLALAMQFSPAWAADPIGIVKPTASCASLAQTDLTAIGGAGSHVVKAAETTKGAITTCAVEGILAPTITFKVELPAATWTQRYLQIGCGGLCGHISLEAGAADGCAVLNSSGFVTASTDMGHDSMGGEFGRDPQKRQDFAYRSVHLTTVTAKKLIEAYYGHGPSHSYFNGCSDGGREALMEAQRYPDDFDGIIAGAPAMNFQVQNGLYHAWQARSNTGADGKAILTAARLPLLHKAVVAACDVLDGQVDGLISDPLKCHFDPGTLLCSATAKNTDSCLITAEVETVRRLYNGPRDPATGERLTIGGPLPGSELAWAGVFVPRGPNEPIFSEIIAMGTILNLNFETNPPADYKLADVTFDRAYFDRLRPLHPFYDATNPDLSAFEKAGGKLILWHGLADQHISPINTIAYYQAVEKLLGAKRAAQFTRLYLFPGMYHCEGGEGPNKIDLLTPMLNWVEKGAAPQEIVARQTASDDASGFGQPSGAPPKDAAKKPAEQSANKVVRSRPVYPYPYTTKYNGKGDPNLVTSYTRGNREEAVIEPWAGADFYQPYKPRAE